MTFLNMEVTFATPVQALSQINDAKRLQENE